MKNQIFWNFHPFDIWWWRFIFEKTKNEKLTLRRIICRIKNHPNGPIYYNAHGLEPDMRCKDCGEDLG
jgi:hypothetical protein